MPQLTLCPVGWRPHALPTAQGLGSAQGLWWPESPSKRTASVGANGLTHGGTPGNGPFLKRGPGDWSGGGWHTQHLRG